MNQAQAIQAGIDPWDIEDFEDTQTGKVKLKNPETGQPSAYFIEFAGPEHPDRKKRVMDKQRRMRAHLQKTGKLQLQDPTEDEEDNLELLVACALGWNLTSKGQPLEFNEANVRKVLTDPKRRWLRDQVQAGFDERENFIARSVDA